DELRIRRIWHLPRAQVPARPAKTPTTIGIQREDDVNVGSAG
ncbi:unnamed protein product, partial [Rotaria sp. Silwood2]